MQHSENAYRNYFEMVRVLALHLLVNVEKRPKEIYNRLRKIGVDEKIATYIVEDVRQVFSKAIRKQAMKSFFLGLLISVIGITIGLLIKENTEIKYEIFSKIIFIKGVVMMVRGGYDFIKYFTSNYH